jgi:hypothetical protein
MKLGRGAARAPAAHNTGYVRTGLRRNPKSRLINVNI